MQKHSVRSAGKTSAMVLEEVAVTRRHSLSLSRDRAWLEGLSSDPEQLLQTMANRKLLYRVGSGRYVVAPRGTFDVQQAAPVELLVDLELREQGDYFLSFLTGLIEHRLTDLHSTRITAAIRQSSPRRRLSSTEIEDHELRVVRLTQPRWPEASELDEVHPVSGATDSYWRATAERTLIDALDRPELSGGFEAVVGAWRRAVNTDTDWDQVCVIAARQGQGMRRRTNFLLRRLGLNDTAERHYRGMTGRGAQVPLDRSRSYRAACETQVRDRETGVIVNVPVAHLRGWIEGGDLG